MIYVPDSLTPVKPIKAATKTFIFVFSLSVALALAYNSGRIDAYKIISGYDFYYRIDSKGEPHKYLGKLDKYFFFLDDNRIIKDGELTQILAGSLPYSTRISIVSEDSLKALQLNRYNPSIQPIDSSYYINFRIRKIAD